jgi:hypothetical protein
VYLVFGNTSRFYRKKILKGADNKIHTISLGCENERRNVFHERSIFLGAVDLKDSIKLSDGESLITLLRTKSDQIMLNTN